EGLQDCLYLGNLDAKRDWGYAPEYTDMMWRILQQPGPDDYVCATGETRTVREFCEVAFRTVGIRLAFENAGVNEIARDTATGKTVIAVSPGYFRPAEVDLLIGDPSKAKAKLG